MAAAAQAEADPRAAPTITLIYVTHDQTEALTFADQVVVMYEGEVVQLGTPQELFERPAHTFVGYFIGCPGMNLLPCRLDGDGVGGRRRHAIALAAAPRRSARGRGAGSSSASGPSSSRVERRAGDGALPATITRVEDLGNYKHRHGAARRRTG